MYENIALTEQTYYILLALVNPAHGYGIMQKTERMSEGKVRLAAGTLYGALNSMVEKRWIEQLPSESGSRKKEYRLTEIGLSVLTAETERLKKLAKTGEAVLKGEEW